MSGVEFSSNITDENTSIQILCSGSSLISETEYNIHYIDDVDGTEKEVTISNNIRPEGNTPSLRELPNRVEVNLEDSVVGPQYARNSWPELSSATVQDIQKTINDRCVSLWDGNDPIFSDDDSEAIDLSPFELGSSGLDVIDFKKLPLMKKSLTQDLEDD